MGRTSRMLRTGLAVLLVAAGFTLITGTPVSASVAAPQVGADTPPPSLTLIVDGQVIQDTSVVESGTTVTAVAGGLLQPGTGTRELRVDLDAATVYESDGVTAPEGWTVEWSTDGGTTWVSAEPTPPASVTNVRATADVVAGDVGLGTQRYTKSVNSSVPASTFSGSTGGDGWDVFFYEDYVLNIFHHNSSYIALDCHLRSTGARCDGFNPTVDASPGVSGSRFPGYQSANRSGGWVNGNSGRAYAFTVQSASRTPGALCINLTVAPPESCGFVALSGQTNVSSYGYLSNAEGAGGRMFGLESINQQLLCLDPATGAACAGSPIQLSGSSRTDMYHVYPLGSKVFASTDTTLYCFEASTLAPCGVSWPVTYASLGWTAVSMSPVAHMDTNGVIDGVCMWSGCLDLAGAEQSWVNPHSVTPWSTNPGANGASGTYGRFEATAGRAYLQRVLSSADIYCFDFATEAACAGFSEQVNDGALYALRADPIDPSCVWYNSDPGRIGLFNGFTGETECTANPIITLQPSSFAPRNVCQSTAGIDRWVSFEMTAANGIDPVTTQTLTMRTAGGDAVPGWTNVPISVGQVLDMSDLPVATTGERPTFNVGFSLSSGTLTDADFEVLYEGPGPELCVDLTVDNSAADGSPNCPVVLDLSASLSEDVSGETTEEAPDRSIVASGSATECPENLIPAGPPGPVADYAVEWTGEGKGLLSFGPPESDGGSPVRWYEYSIDGGPWRLAPTSPDGDDGFTVPLTGLIEGETYETSVRAVNQLGAGEVVVESLTAVVPTTTTTTSTTVPPTTAAPTTTPPTTAAPAVAAAADTTPESLPATGGGAGGVVWAVLFVAIGGIFLVVARRFRRS